MHQIFVRIGAGMDNNATKIILDTVPYVCELFQNVVYEMLFNWLELGRVCSYKCNFVYETSFTKIEVY